MVKRGDPKVLRFVVLILHHVTGLSQKEFGKIARVDQGTISDCEGGKVAPSEEALRRMAVAAGVPWPLVVHLRRFFTAFVGWLDRAKASALPALQEEDGESPVEQAALDATRLAMIPYRMEEQAAEAEGRPPEEERREAEEIWAALSLLPAAERQRWLDLSVRAAGSWALAERIAHASEQMAADEAERAQRSGKPSIR